MRLNRRTVMLAAAAAMLPLPARADPALTADELKTLTQLVRDLFPHRQLTGKDYRAIAARVASQLTPAARIEAWRDGLKTLDAGKPGSWASAGAAQRLARLTAMTTDPLFADWRATTIIALYHTPAYHQRFGFPGPSVDFGGYLDAGLNDITWLDEPRT